jgi:hypothetical protein
MQKPDHLEKRAMRPGHRRREAGFTFAELGFGLLVLVIGAAVLINHLAINYQATNSERDRVFAFSKAQAILAEVQNYVDRGSLDTVELDVLDDGVTNRPTLTIQTDDDGNLVAADHVRSGNIRRGGEWLWSRRISVQPFPGVDNRNVRYVTVRIFRRDANGTERAAADLSAVVNSAGGAFPTAQAYDVYLLAVENIPGWWVFMDSLKPFFESMLLDMQTRNPGLTFRTHWITKAAFGRNQLYRPYTNDETDSHAAIPHVYHYPGRMPDGNASAYYYVPDNMRARINVDGEERHGHGPLNPHPYALADFFNHAMRYEDELALWNQRVAAITQREQEIADAILNGSTPPDELEDMSKEPTLRLLLEGMNANPAYYRNALVINLHGELLPMPALRNYSDPAKSQVAYPNLRVVTHPEELRTRNNEGGVSDALALRMYAWGYQTSATPYAGSAGSVPVLRDPMVVDIVGLNLTNPLLPTRLSAACTLTNVPGGVPVGGTSNYPTSWQAAKHATDTPAPVADEMHYTAEWVPPAGGASGYTRLYLYNTPVGAPPVTQSGLTYGLAATERARLYQMEYIPSPVSTTVGTPAFTPDLTSSGTGPKNTARWRLQIAHSVLATNGITTDYTVAVRTRIGTGHTSGSTAWQSSGTVWPTPDDPDNLSVTYAYWTNSGEDVPFTERAQFHGDPRHLPYRDCFNGGNDFPNSYNWYLDDLRVTTTPVEYGANDYPGLVITSGTPATTRLSDRWGNGAAPGLTCDVPRLFQLLREGLVKSRCVYSSITGWSYYYLGVGNDIGYDAANGYANSIPSNLAPHGSPGANGFINTITGARKYVRAVGASDYWWGIPWLGELYPDRVLSSQWLDTAGGTLPPRGNLTAGTTSGQFYQANCNAVYANSTRQAYGTVLLDHGQRTSSFGCTTLFNIGTSASTFQHSSSTANGTLTSLGAEMSANYGLSAPTSAPISRPFRINVASGVAEHWNHPPYASSPGRYTATTFKTYYSHSAGAGSAAIKLVDPTNTNAAYVVVNGISNAVTNGTSFIAEYTLLSLLHTMLEAGSTTNTLRIQQQPRVEIESPTAISELENPSKIDVQYGVEWRRWDGLPYSQTGTFSESESQLEYVIHVSRDGGDTWTYVQDDTPSVPGTRPSSATYLLPDLGAGPETYEWDVSTDYPEGVYRLRIDCFRTGAQQHYAYHQTSLFIQR